MENLKKKASEQAAVTDNPWFQIRSVSCSEHHR